MTSRRNLMSPQELAEFLGGNVNVGTIYKMNYAGTGPPFIRVGKYVRYDPVDVERWLAEHRVDTG